MKKHFQRGLWMIFSCLWVHAGHVHGQDFPQALESLSEEQRAVFLDLFQQQGGEISPELMEAYGRNYGLSAERIEDLMELSESEGEALEEYSTKSKKYRRPLALSKTRRSDDFEIYGMALFEGVETSFVPSLNIPTPVGYRLGAGDQLIINVWGDSEKRYKRMISKHGNIFIPNVGPIYVSGMTLGAASERIKRRLSTLYEGLSSKGGTYCDVSIGITRSIKVNVIGAVYQPGTYTLPPFGTLFHALYHAGGPLRKGSFRQIELIRGGEKIASLDLYAYLSGTGGAAASRVLQDQDVVRVPPYVHRILLRGAFKQTGKYEGIPGSTIGALLDHAGGFDENARKGWLRVRRNKDGKRSIFTVQASAYDTFLLADGDIWYADDIVDIYTSRIRLHGAVLHPGEYEWVSGMGVQDLLREAAGLRREAYTPRGLIYRLQKDSSFSSSSFPLGDILAGKVPDIALENEDIVLIHSMADMRDDLQIAIFGEIRSPGIYPYVEGMTIEDLILSSGGMNTYADHSRIEVSRQASTLSSDTKLYAFSVDEALPFRLAPSDNVFIRKQAHIRPQAYVIIAGEVVHTGLYTLRSPSETISDVIKRAGGFTKDAYIEGASLTRVFKNKETYIYPHLHNLEQVETRQIDELLFGNGNKVGKSGSVQDSLLQEKTSDIEAEEGVSDVSIEMEKIMKFPKSPYDLRLEDRDRLYIPRRIEWVSTKEGVLYPTYVRYRDTYHVKDYISFSGGFHRDALKKKVYVRNMNGSIEATKRFLFFKSYPKVMPGSEIVVPLRSPPRHPLTPQQWIALSTGIGSLALIMVTILNRLED